MAYDPTIYLGSAAHYRYGRPTYSPGLEAVLTREAGLDGNGRLLDVGCGPGVLTVRLAHLFEQAVGLDPDADMLAEGRRAAGEKGAANIRWVQGLAEDLPAAAPGPYRLVTFGQSFHWTDEQQVAETVYDMLEPGGALALIVHTVTGRPRPPDPGVPPIPHDEIRALVEKYLGSNRRAGQGTFPERTHRFEDVLARTRFGVPRRFFVPGIPDLLRDSESVLSGYFSLSSAAPHLFGDRLDEFAGEARALLAQRSAEGLFWDWPGDTEVVQDHEHRRLGQAGTAAARHQGAYYRYVGDPPGLPDSELMPKANELAAKPPTALRAAKRTANEVEKMADFELAFTAVESRVSLSLIETVDHKEAAVAFQQRRTTNGRRLSSVTVAGRA